MAKIMHPAEELTEITLDELMMKTMELKKAGRRLSQICCAFIDDKYELSYSFANDESYEYTTLRLNIDTGTRVPSITDIFPSAVFYENEMKEMFGVSVEMISVDYENRFYRITAEHPLKPEKEGA